MYHAFRAISFSLTVFVHELFSCFRALSADQNGIESVEWAVIAAIIVAGAASTYGIIFPALGQFFTTFGAALATPTVSL